MYTCLRNVLLGSQRGFQPSSQRASKIAFKAVLSARLSCVLLGSTLLLGSVGQIARAQQVDPLLRESFLADPLTQDPQDPLLPVLAVERPYSPLEKQAIAANLNQLNAQAQQQLATGNVDAAFALWRRELQLRRVLGTNQEFTAIARVAEIAWARQQSVDVRLLTLRAREIWAAAKTSLDVEREDQLGGSDMGIPEDSLISGSATADIATLGDLANTFVTLRDVESAVEVYEQLIVLSRDRTDVQTVQQIALAELHLEWFQFAEATNIYLMLLSNAETTGDTEKEIEYLQQLAYTYQQAKSLPNAVRAQTDLLERYQAQGEEEEFPELMVAIAQNYRTLNLHTSAIDYYRAAYQAAQRFDQFSFSAQVLKDLGELYESLALTDDALGTYTLLVPVEQQAYNDYGVMNAYDKIGQIQRRRGDNLEALKAFERALVIATRLGIQEDYFIEQIGSVT